MNDPHDIEALAAQEHESWAKWTSYMLDRLEAEKAGDIDPADMEDYDLEDEFIDGLPCVKRWRRQINTPYADLSEREKESDREVVREKLQLYRNDEQQ